MQEVDSLLKRLLQEGSGKTTPGAWYSPEGDCIFCYKEDVDDYAEYVDKWLTIYRAEEDDRIIGVQVKHISNISKDAEMIFAWFGPDSVDIVHLILEVREESPPTDAEVYKAKLFDAVQAMRGQTIDKKELEPVLG